MLDLALSKSSSPVPGKDIAERQGISKSYLDNLMGPLRIAGLVRTIRGVGGGFTLAKPPSQIKMSDIWMAMEGSIYITNCIKQPDSCDRYERCITRYVWQEANEALETTFQSWTLEDMANKIESDLS